METVAVRVMDCPKLGVLEPGLRLVVVASDVSTLTARLPTVPSLAPPTSRSTETPELVLLKTSPPPK